jgi:hypothetical protein
LLRWKTLLREMGCAPPGQSTGGLKQTMRVVCRLTPAQEKTTRTALMSMTITLKDKNNSGAREELLNNVVVLTFDSGKLA